MQVEGRPIAQAGVVSRAGTRETAAAILLIGALSMFFAEALSGSSVLWFLVPFAWSVAFPLYLAHMLLFVNLALRFGRLSMLPLYLWGVLFGLYEAWVTKVAWAGYIGAAPGWGTVLGFSFPEVLIVVLFWHPVFSWILPLLAFEVLGDPAGVLPLHRRHLVRSGRTTTAGVAVAAIGALFLATNAHGDPVAVVVTIVGSVALIAACLRVARGRGHPLTMESLRLGRRGMMILLGYLALLYGLTFVLLVPERIAPPLTIALTVGLYGVVALLIRGAGPDRVAAEPATIDAAPLVSRRDLGRGLGLLVMLGIAFAIALPVAYPFVVLTYLALVVAGPLLFGWAVAGVARARRAAR